MSVSKPTAPAPAPLSVPAPIVFGDEDAAAAELSAFADGEVTAPHERPEGWASLAARRLRSMSGESAGS